MFLSIDGGRSHISDITSQGPVTDILQLSGSRSQASGNASQGPL
jgi:hypothetical protein